MIRTSKPIKYLIVPEYHLYFHKDTACKNNLLVYKFSVKFIYTDLKIGSVYIPFKYKNLNVVLSTEETYIYD